MKGLTALLCAALLCLPGVPSFAMETMERLNMLEKAIKEQSKIIDEQQKTIDALKAEINSRKADAVVAQADTVKPVDNPSSDSGTSGFFGGSALTNPNISLVVDTSAYTSNLNKGELEERGSEQRKGFNLRSAELFLFAPVDSYFNLYAALPVTEEGIELEEAYAVTTSLPFGFQIKGGKFKSNFSRVDAQHPHAWDFVDIALPYKTFLGDEALGGEKGVQVTYIPPIPIYTLFGGEILQGENNHLFGADARSGPHAYTLFAKVSIDTSVNSTLLFGPYFLFGQTRQASGDQTLDFRGSSNLWGGEAVWKWNSGMHSVTLQGEYIHLSQGGSETNNNSDEIASRNLHQDGAYFQALYRYDRWRVGARYDTLDIFSDSLEVGGEKQDLGRRPWRTTASLEFNPSEFSRIRLQYTHDRSDRVGRDNDEWWLQVIFGIGAHGAHEF